MEQVFNYTTTAQIDARLYKDILEHEDNIEKTCIIIYLILLFIFRGWVWYWIKFGVAIPSSYETKPINITIDPIQKNYTKEEQEKRTFTYKSLINKNKIELIPQAHYKLSGSVVAYNHDFIFTDSFFDSAALYDLGASWGKLGNKDFYNKYFSSYSQKNEITGSRILWTEFKSLNRPVSIEYATSHWSHSHIVPANRNIMAAFLKLKEWDKIQIEGELVDMKYYRTGKLPLTYKTSLARSGANDDRGNGTCETIYVTKIRVGNFVYK